MRRGRAVLIWTALLAAILLPVAAAAFSPLLQWRQPVYIAAGFAGIVGMAMLLVQPLLAGGYLPGLATIHGRWLHRWVGGLLVIAIVAHVGGLWITSPPDVVDVLLFRSPTPFSVWGVIAMWAAFAAALLAGFRRRLRLRPRTWRLAHTFLAFVIVAGSVIHALLIEGTMETFTKAALCVLVVAVFLGTVADLKVWVTRRRRDA